MIGLEISKIATENLKAQYKARFTPHTTKEGYLFSHEYYGEGVFCSKEQYRSLVEEFEAFINSRSHFMFWWFVLLIVLGSTIGIVDIFYYKLNFLHSKVWKDSWIGSYLMLFPLLFIVPQGWRLYKKPLIVLGSDREFARSKKPREEIMDRRIKGMSWTMLILGIGVSLLGIYFYLNGGDYPPYSIYLTVGVLLMNLYFSWRKYNVYRKEREVLKQQQKL